MRVHTFLCVGVNEMRRQRKQTAKRTNGALSELTEKASRDIPYIEMLGNGEAVVDGCKGMLEYNEDGIALNAGACVLRFTGRNLTIRAYSESQTEIHGDIQSVEFTR